MDVCYQYQVVTHCKCYDYESFKYWDVDVCYTDSNIDCLNEIYKNMSSSNILNEYCYNECPLECDIDDFTTTLSTSQFPPNDYYLNQFRSLPIIKSKYSNISSISDQELTNSLLKLSIYYNTLSYTLISESPTMGVVDLLSNLGGVLGLFLGSIFFIFLYLINGFYLKKFLGMSVISFVELIELLLQIFYYALTNRKRSKIEAFAN
jgi:hypothetical protein